MNSNTTAEALEEGTLAAFKAAVEPKHRPSCVQAVGSEGRVSPLPGPEHSAASLRWALCLQPGGRERHRAGSQGPTSPKGLAASKRVIRGTGSDHCPCQRWPSGL